MDELKTADEYNIQLSIEITACDSRTGNGELRLRSRIDNVLLTPVELATILTRTSDAIQKITEQAR